MAGKVATKTWHLTEQYGLCGPTKASCLSPKLFRPTVAHATDRYSGRTPLAQSPRRCCCGIWTVTAVRANDPTRLILKRADRLEPRRLRRGKYKSARL
jgi:hypothetical protein